MQVHQDTSGRPTVDFMDSEKKHCRMLTFSKVAFLASRCTTTQVAGCRSLDSRLWPRQPAQQRPVVLVIAARRVSLRLMLWCVVRWAYERKKAINRP